MSRIIHKLSVFLICGFIGGCALWDGSVELTRTIWGSSTRALENVRDGSVARTYRCSTDECYSAVVDFIETPLGVVAEEEAAGEESADSIEEEEEEIVLFTGKVVKKNKNAVYGRSPAEGPVHINTIFDIFIKDPIKQHIVVMGVPESVDTTEVGIFFDSTAPGETLVEISSLSTNAKTIVAEHVFAGLTKEFAEVK